MKYLFKFYFVVFLFQSGCSTLLDNMEKGRENQINGALDQSIVSYEDALKEVKENDEKASVSLGDSASQTAAVLANDNVIPYEGESFERTMLHTFQAMNYMFKGDISNATPEVRLAGDNQKKDLEEHQKEINKAVTKENKINENQMANIMTKYAGLDETAGYVKNSFQNAYAYYVAGLIYELNGEPEQAYKDYQNALEIFPNNTYVQRDTIFLAKKLGMNSDLASYRKRFPTAYNFVKNQKVVKTGDVVLLIEDGTIAKKEELKIPFPIDLKGGIVTVALPIYNQKYEIPSKFNISLNDKKSLGDANLICNFNSLAYKALKEKLPQIITRQVIRVVTRVAGQVALDQVEKNSSSDDAKTAASIGKLAFSVGSFFAENADLRGWYSLPQNAQIFRTNLNAGKNKLVIKDLKDGMKKEIEITVVDNKKNVIRVVKNGQSFSVQERQF